MSDECQVRQDGDHVIIRFKTSESRVPYGAALAISEAIGMAAKQAEAFAKHNQTIAGAVILEKTGLRKEWMQGLPLRIFKRGNNA